MVQIANPFEVIEKRLSRIEGLLLDIKHGELKSRIPEKSDGYITRAQVCKALHITLPTVHAWMKEGKLKAYHIGGRTLFKESEVLESVKPVNYSIK